MIASCRGTQRASCLAHDRGAPGVVGRRDEQERLRARGKPSDPVEEGTLHPRGQGKLHRERRLAGELIGGERVRELDEREGVATGAGHEPVEHAAGTGIPESP